MTGSNILIPFFLLCFGLHLLFWGKNYLLTGYSLVMGLLEFAPLMTGVLGPFESVEFGLVLSSLPLLYEGNFSFKSKSLLLRC